MFRERERQIQLAKDLRDSINDAESYAAYAGMVARWYEKRDLYSKWIVALAACGPFIDKLTIESSNAAAWLVALIPLVSIALPLLNYSRKMELANSVHSQYVGILPTLKALWRKVLAIENQNIDELNSLAETLEVLEEKLSDIRSNKSEMPEIISLANKAKERARTLELPEFLSQIPPPPLGKDKPKKENSFQFDAFGS